MNHDTLCCEWWKNDVLNHQDSETHEPEQGFYFFNRTLIKESNFRLLTWLIECLAAIHLIGWEPYFCKNLWKSKKLDPFNELKRVLSWSKTPLWLGFEGSSHLLTYTLHAIFVTVGLIYKDKFTWQENYIECGQNSPCKEYFIVCKENDNNKNKNSIFDWMMKVIRALPHSLS